jgi:hypothetical protein
MCPTIPHQQYRYRQLDFFVVSIIPFRYRTITNDDHVFMDDIFFALHLIYWFFNYSCPMFGFILWTTTKTTIQYNIYFTFFSLPLASVQLLGQLLNFLPITPPSTLEFKMVENKLNKLNCGWWFLRYRRTIHGIFAVSVIIIIT